MKDGLIRLTGEKDIFYDSIEKVYRYRIYCISCGVIIPGCICYYDLDCLEMEIDNGLANTVCSSKCYLKCWVDTYGMDELTDALRELGIWMPATIYIPILSTDQIKNYLKANMFIGFKKDRKSMITILEENMLLDDILNYYKVEYKKPIQSLTEQECTTLATYLNENADTEYSSGEQCSI